MRIAALALCVPAICLAQTPAQPRMVLDTTLQDFGQIAPDATVIHRFKVTNGGNANLKIAEVRPSCGCTSTLVGKQLLAPGESTEVEMTFHASGSRGVTRKSVDVVSDDPKQPVQTFTFQANVLPAVILATDQVRFEDLVRGDRRKASLKLETGTRQPIQLNDVALSKAPWLGVSTREEGQTLYVDFELLAKNLPPSKLSGTDTVTLKVANPLPTTVWLSVHWERRAPVIATPARVAWAEPAGQELAADLRLDSRDRRPFRILSARTSNPLLRVLGISPRAATCQALQIHLSPTASPGLYEEKAILTLDAPGHPEFEIRVSAILR